MSQWSTEEKPPALSVWGGGLTMLAGIGMVLQVVYRFVMTTSGSPDEGQMLRWWEQVPIGGLAIFCGALLSGWSKPRGAKSKW